MKRTTYHRLLLAAPLLLAAADLAVPMRSEVGRPWPFFSADEPAEPPVLAPAAAVKSFAMAPGYAVELVAAEPLVQDPILIEHDGDGRLWVMELPGWAHNLAMENSLEPVNRLVVLDDTNGDGIYDKRTVFADRLVLPRAFKVLIGGCVLIGEPPTLWKACDTDGDSRADSKVKLADGFARLGVLEHGANGLYWGMDNLLVVSEHEWNLAYRSTGPGQGQFVTVPGLRRGQWGVTQDDSGRIYRNVNTDPLFVDNISPDYFARNPDLVRTRGLYENLVDQEKTNIWPAHPTFGLNRGYRREVFRGDGTASYYGGVSSPLIYRGNRLPADVRGMAFVADGATNIVHLLRLADDGQGRLRAEDYYPRGEFLASTDVRFRPTALALAPDGSITIADMYRGVSQDGPLQTDYLRDYITKRGLARGVGHGRIYRVVHVGSDGARAPRPQMSKDSVAALVGHLSHPDGWWRDTAQQHLVQRADAAAVPLLVKLARNAKADWRSRLHALWTLNGMGAMRPDLAGLALRDARPELRAAGLRLAEPWLAKSDAKLTKAALALAGDANWQVRVQAAASLGALPEAARTQPMIALLAVHGDDPVLVDAALSGLKGGELPVLMALACAPAAPKEAVAMLAGALAKRRDAATGQQLVALAGRDDVAPAIRTAVLDGLALGFAGGVQGGGNAVAGGRAGGNIPGVARARGGVERFALAAEPAAISRLAAAGDAPAQKLLALVTWPGRPAPPALPPRTASEEALFKQGQAIYVEQCAGCHQTEGQGQATVAPPLAGSKRVAASGDVPVRILTNGLEGKIGLMPPLGGAMSDAEVAAVLTYVRQSFGNRAAPLPPAAVKEWRLAFAHRTTPWSEKDIDAPQR